MELLIRPREDFLPHASLEDLQQISRLWISEIKFCQDELKFYLFLTENFFPKKSLDDKALLDEIEEKLIDFKNDEFTLATRNVELHLIFLREMEKEGQTNSMEVCREEHKKLELEIVNFMKDFKKLKLHFMDFTRKLRLKSIGIS